MKTAETVSAVSDSELLFMPAMKATALIRAKKLSPVEYVDAVLKAIDKDPKQRYASTEAMAEDLRRFLDDEPIQARRTSAIERFARNGQTLSATGKGTVTINPGAADDDASGNGTKPECSFTATLPFTHTLPAGC